MAGLGIGIAWAGYALLYYGVTQVQGGNWGLLDLCIPSRWAAASGNPKDDGTKSAPGILNQGIPGTGTTPSQIATGSEPNTFVGGFLKGAFPAPTILKKIGLWP